MKIIAKQSAKIIIIMACFLILSCQSIQHYRTARKEAHTTHFFNQWYAESQQIIEKNNAQGELQKSINEILTLYLSKDEKNDFNKRFPKLEYYILQEHIKVSMYTELESTPHEEQLIFSDINFVHSVPYSSSGKKILIFTPKYKRILQKKLPYGFTDQTEKHNNNARAALTKMGEDMEYDIPAQIYILFNAALDSAIVYRYRNGSFGVPFWFRYSKENGFWKEEGIHFNIRIP